MRAKIRLQTLITLLLLSSPLFAQSSSQVGAIRSSDEHILVLAKLPHDEGLITKLLTEHSQYVTREVWQTFMDGASQKLYENQIDGCLFFYEVARLVGAHLHDFKLIGTTYYYLRRC